MVSMRRVLFSVALIALGLVGLSVLGIGSTIIAPYSTQTFQSTSYNSFVQYETSTYTDTAYYTYSEPYTNQVCIPTEFGAGGYVGCQSVPDGVVTVVYTQASMSTGESPYQVEITNTEPFQITSTLSGSILRGEPTVTLAVIMILILMVGIVSILLNRVGITKPHGQAKLSQFITPKSKCVECGMELPPKSTFCNHCGTKQS